VVKINTPSYIKSLLMPQTRKPQGRRVWSIDLETVWLPFFTATNTMGDTAIPVDALGCPLRLGYAKDGSVKFSQTGRPVVSVAKEISQSVAMVRDNFVANLCGYALDVANNRKDDYGNMVNSARKAGEPIYQHDKAKLDEAIKAQIEANLAEAEKQPEPEPEPEPEQEPEREKVPA